MKREWVKNTKGIIAILLNHLLFIAAAITVMDLFQVGTTRLFLWIALVVVPFGYFAYVKKSPKMITPPLYIVVLGVLSMIETIMKQTQWSGYYLIIAFVFLCGYLFYYYLEQYEKFLKLNEKSASNIPEMAMFKNGLKQTGMFAIGSFFVLLMTVNFRWMEKVAGVIYSWILAVLRMIFLGIQTSPPPEQQGSMEEMNNNLSGYGDAVDAPFFPEFVQDIAQTLVLLFFGFIFVVGCILFMILVYHIVKNHLIPKKVIKDSSILKTDDDVREYCGIERNSQRAKQSFTIFDPRKRIRKIFYKRVIKKKRLLIGERDEKLLRLMTAKECCETLEAQHLKTVYEKARYSSDDVTVEDVRLANK